MSTLQSVTSLVQKLLGDYDRGLWEEQILTPFVNSAYEDLVDRLRDASVEAAKFRQEFTVNAGVTNLVRIGNVVVTSYEQAILPENTITPDALWDNDVGTTGLQGFILMTGPTTLPNVPQTSVLRYWDWSGSPSNPSVFPQENIIRLVGATQARRVMMDYYGELVPVHFLTDLILIKGSTNALAYLVAANVAYSRGQVQEAQGFYARADGFIRSMINQEIKAQQAVPSRRLPMRGSGRYLRLTTT